jgi:hypothetical protein
MERCNFLTESVGALAGEALPRIAAAQSVSATQATMSGDVQNSAFQPSR